MATFSGTVNEIEQLSGSVNTVPTEAGDVDLAKIQQSIGELSELETEAKGSLVAAINEVRKAVGSGSGGSSGDSSQNVDQTPEIKSVLTDIVTFLKAVPFDDTVVSASDLDNIQTKIDALASSGDDTGDDDTGSGDDTGGDTTETVTATFADGVLAISGVTINSATFSGGVLAVV